ncbi:MAG TPA: helix-turn-helix domain-containing protein [Thermoleophilaceae bacterium]
MCSVARALEAIGDRWTMLVIRDAFHGVSRFDDFQQRLGIARNVLTDRLNRLTDEGILVKHPYQERPERFEYRLTEKGLDLFPVLMSLMKWGDRHAPDADGPPLVVVHRDCGGEIDARLRCARCGESITALNAEALQPAPSAG